MLSSFLGIWLKWTVENLFSFQVRNQFGCFDEILEIDDHEVRHCNWIRFLRSTSDFDEVNLVARQLKNRGPVFQVIRPVPSNGELRVYFDDEAFHLNDASKLRSITATRKSFSPSPQMSLVRGFLQGVRENHLGFTAPHPTPKKFTSPYKDFISPSDLRTFLLKDKSTSDCTTFTSPSSGFDSPSHHFSTLLHSSTTPSDGVETEKSKSNTPPPRHQELVSIVIFN